MEPKLFGIYGKSNTGKTTLIVKIIKELSKMGLNIATIKITDKEISMDTEKKDTFRYNKAGSNIVVFSSAKETDFLHFKILKTGEILNYLKKFGNYDIILIEGAYEKNIQKIRIGDIDERENTILTYDGNFDEIINLIKEKLNR
jgi:molybdopterin-guanine dinucleotide biosynthesis protein B